MFGPSSRTAGLLCPRLTSGRPSPRLSTRVALRQTARSPRVLRTHLPAYACRIYVAAFHARTGLCIYWPAYPAAPPLSASCSSGQRFACGFLRIPPHDGHPCRSANTSPCRVCRGLSPPSECALPGAPMKMPRLRSGHCLCISAGDLLITLSTRFVASCSRNSSWRNLWYSSHQTVFGCLPTLVLQKTWRKRFEFRRWRFAMRCRDNWG